MAEQRDNVKFIIPDAHALIDGCHRQAPTPTRYTYLNPLFRQAKTIFLPKSYLSTEMDDLVGQTIVAKEIAHFIAFGESDACDWPLYGIVALQDFDDELYEIRVFNDPEDTPEDAAAHEEYFKDALKAGGMPYYWFMKYTYAVWRLYESLAEHYDDGRLAIATDRVVEDCAGAFKNFYHFLGIKEYVVI